MLSNKLHSFGGLGRLRATSVGLEIDFFLNFSTIAQKNIRMPPILKMLLKANTQKNKMKLEHKIGK